MSGHDDLAALLPRWYRQADQRLGGPLAELLEVIGEQLAEIRAATGRQYDNWFVETAAEDMLPYLGDLVGYRPLPGGAWIQRRDVAATVGYRRRKGTLALLEELAGSAAGYPARAVETSALIARTQPVRLYGSGGTRGDTLRASRGRLADLRDGGTLDLVGTPFETTARTPDVRRAASRRRPGGYSPAGVRLYVWRSKPYPVIHAPAYCRDRARNQYTFSVLGNDTPLVTRPEPEPSATHIAAIDNVPARIRRRQLADRLADYYGPGKSLGIWRGDRAEPVPLSDIVVADLSGWRYRPARGQVAVDPELGRIAFSARESPDGGVWVSYHYAFSDDIGGGGYPRLAPPAPGSPRHGPVRGAPVYRVGPGQPHEQIMDAFGQYRADRDAGAGPGGIIEISGSDVYHERLEFTLAPGDRLTVRAADGARPVLRLLDWSVSRRDAFVVRAVGDCEPGAGPCLSVDGLLITGRGMSVTGPVEALDLRHCTLVPGWSVDASSGPAHPATPSLVLDRAPTRVTIDHCILGTIEVIADEAGTDPLPLLLRDSILDATGHDRPALTAPDRQPAHAELSASRSTILGEVNVHAVATASDTIVTGTTRVTRRQAGCLRFCYVPPGSRTPPRYQCQPDLAGPDGAARVRPSFSSVRYGTPDYARLADSGPDEIARGAADGAEMGVFHDLCQPQRADSLRVRLAEYTPAGSDAGISNVT